MRCAVLPVALLMVFGAATCVLGVGLPAGHTFEIVAEADYSDAWDGTHTADPAVAELTVMQVSGVSVQDNAPEGPAALGEWHYIPISIFNTGNGIDSFDLLPSSSKGWTTSVVYDGDGDGEHDPNENWVMVNSGSIIADAHVPCFLRVFVPATATSGDTVYLAVTSDYDPLRGSTVLDFSISVPGPPAVTISSPTGAALNTDQPTVNASGTVSCDETISSVAWSTDRGASGVCVGTNSWTAAAIPLQAGDNAITITATDAFARVGTASVTVTYTEPGAPSVAISSPTSNAEYSTQQATLSLAGSASDEVGVSSVTWSSDRGGSGSCTGTTSWSVAGIALSAGRNVITITAANGAGKTASDVLTVTRVVDGEPPTVQITGPTTAATYSTDQATLNVSGIASDDVAISSVTWSNDRGGSGSCTGTTSWTAAGIELSAGENVITISVTDTSDKTTTDVLTVTRVVDAASPVVQILDPTGVGSYATQDDTIGLSGLSSDDIEVVSVAWSNDRGGSGACTGTTSWSVAGIALLTGQNVITITATDTSGRTGSDTLIVNRITDTQSPAVLITAPTTTATYSTDQATVDLSGTASDDVEVSSVQWSNDRGGSGACTGTTTWTATGISLSAGQNVLTVTVTDFVGKTGTAVLTVTRIVDNELPAVEITGPTTDAAYETDQDTLDLSGTTSDDIEVATVDWSNDRGGSGTCTGTTSWAATDVALSAGQNVIVVTVTDTAGKTAVDVLTVTRTVDASAPTVQIAAPTASDTYSTMQSAISLSGTASDDVTVQSVAWSNDRGGSGACTGTASWTVSAIALLAGQNVLTITVTDDSGKTGTDVLTVTRLVDASAPTVQITGPTSAATYSTDGSTVSLSGTATDDQTITSVAWVSDRGGSGTCVGTSTWTANGIALLAGENVITVTVTDNSGKTGTDVLTVTRNVDASAPTVQITGPTASATYETDQATLSLSGTASDDQGVESVAWSNDRGGSGTCTGTTSWTVSGIALSAGQNVLTVTVTDTSGKTGTDVLAVTRNVDASAPTVQITGPTTSATYSTDDTALDIAGTASDDVAVESVAWSNDRGGSGTCTGTASWTATGIALSVGQNVLTVTVTDTSGKTGTDVLTVTRTVDTAAPTLAITSPTTEASCVRNSAVLYLAGTVSDDTGVTSLTWANAATGDSGDCTVSDGSWSASGIDLIEGENALTVTASDAAGNPASAELTVTYVADVAPGDAWRGRAMISLPIIPDQADPKPVVGFADGGWFAFDTANNVYAGYDDPFSWFDPADATPGRGFWAYFEGEADLPQGSIPPQDQPATIHLATGWNLIGTPFISPVTWDVDTVRVQVAGQAAKSMRLSKTVVADFAWGWQQDAADPDTGSYRLVCDASVAPDADHELKPWRAYWIKAYRACDLILSLP